MIQYVGQLNHRGRLVGGWRIGTLAGKHIKGARVYNAVRETASRKFDQGDEAIVMVAGASIRTVHPGTLVPEHLLGTHRSFIAMLSRCGNTSNSRVLCNGSYVPKGIKVFTPWTPIYYGDFSAASFMSALIRFADDVGERLDGEQLHRVSTDGHYFPGEVFFCDKKLHDRLHASLRAQAAFGLGVKVVDTGFRTD